MGEVACDWKTLWYVKPEILSQNTYFWHGFYGNSSQRYDKSQKYVDEVEKWFNQIKECITKTNKELGKELEIETDDYPCVYLYDGDEEIGKFCITSSRSNVYKKQNIRPIKSLIRKELGNNMVEVKKIGKIDDDNMIRNLRGIYVEKDKVYLAKPTNAEKKGDVELVKYKNRKYVGIYDGEQMYMIKDNPKDIIDTLGDKIACSSDFIKLVDNAMTKKKAEEYKEICMSKIL